MGRDLCLSNGLAALSASMIHLIENLWRGQQMLLALFICF